MDNERYDENVYIQPEQDYCRRCRKRPIDKSENPDSVLCRDCREELIKLRIPMPLLVTGIIVAIIVILCMGVFVMDFFRFRVGFGGHEVFQFNDKEEIMEKTEEKKEDVEEFLDSIIDNRTEEEKTQDTIRDLQEDMENMPDPMYTVYSTQAGMGQVVTAMDGILTELEENPDDMDMAILLADIAMEYSYFDYAAYAINEYLVDKSVSDEEYDRITGYIEELEIYYATAEELDNIWASLTEPVEGEELDLEAVYSSYHDKVQEFVGDERYDQARVHYELYYCCLYEEEEMLQHLKDCIAEDPCYYGAQAQLAVYHRRKGDFETAREILQKTYFRNREDYSVLRAYATLELAEGNLEDGLIYAEEAYKQYADGEYVIDTYLIALTANGRQEEADALLREYEDAGYYFDEDFYAFQMGDMTLEEYYVGE